MSSDARQLLDPLMGGSAVAHVFSDRARLQGMLDFEAALARAEAQTGVIPQGAVAAIAGCCEADRFDLPSLASASVAQGNLAIPMVRQLTDLVAVADADAARYVHWGATSQDAIDTGIVLQFRDALGVLEADLARLSDALAKLATDHKLTPCVGRTWLQHALPITFGLKAAGWLDGVERHRARLADLRPRLLVLQFGGAAGTLAALGGKGLAVAEALAADLRLGLPAMPWHTERGTFAEFASFLGALTGTLGKLARDVSLMMQTEVGEAFEAGAPGRGGSSTMPHKRNPIASAAVLAAAVRAPGLVATVLAGMVQEHERALGGWQAEWAVLPELAVLAAGALRHMAETMAGLEVDTARMRRNLDATQGLIMAEAVQMALGVKLGRLVAHDRVEAACHRAVKERRHLREVLREDKTIMAQLSAPDLDRLFDPLNYLGVAAALVDRVLAARR
ncbi:MAG TPA: 3-carboxy-cis,cis-muconate cycloisomerase [Candidatus Cybelea sp.]|nr:3-carboxy-cis,cis-muconate cycloisomerase [Candidatus Cybelea sp.]